MKSVSDLRVQIFADGADKASMLELYRQPFIKGFTTNPTLMRAIGDTALRRPALRGALAPAWPAIQAAARERRTRV